MKRHRPIIILLVLAFVAIAGVPALTQEETPEKVDETPAEEAPATGAPTVSPEESIPEEPAEEKTEPPAAKEEREPSAAAKAKWTRLVGNARVGRRHWVAGATVLVMPEWNLPRIFVTSTDEKGTFRLDQLEEGRYDVRFLKYGFAPVEKKDVALEFPFQAVVEVVMEEATGPAPPLVIPARGSVDSTAKATVRGTVVNRKGEPLAEVRIRMLKADGTVDPVFAQTDEEGAFEFAEIAPGLWNIEIYGAGYLPIRAPASWYSEMELRAVLVSQPATYEPQPLDLMPPERPIPPRGPMDADAQANAGVGN